MKGIMTEAGLYPSNLYKKSKNMRKGGFSPSRGSRTPAGLSSELRIQSSFTEGRPATEGVDNMATQDTSVTSTSSNGARRRRRRRPSTAVESHAPGPFQVPNLPLSSRCPTSHDARANSIREGRDSRVGSGLGIGRALPAAEGRTTTLEIQRARWVEASDGETGRLDGDAEMVVDTPETDECVPQTDGDGQAGESSAAQWDAAPPPQATLAWGEAMRELSTTVSKVVCCFYLYCWLRGRVLGRNWVFVATPCLCLSVAAVGSDRRPRPSVAEKCVTVRRHTSTDFLFN